jgi:hypothetical protein
MVDLGLTRADDSALLLPGESTEDTVETLRRRAHLRDQLRDMPDDVFSRLQYLQPQVGCFNRCLFCSQHAGTDIWQFTRRGLTDFLVAFASVAAERVGTRGRIARDRPHKPGELFPYVDNDIGSYAHLDHYIDQVDRLLGCKTRLTTVGFSAGAAPLVAMHRRIVDELSDAVSGFRLSITPFTYGWTEAGERSGGTTRRRFVADLAHLLRLYRPLIDRLGTGKSRFCAELRFRPLAAPSPVTDTVVDGHHVVAAGPHLLIEHGRTGRPPEPGEVAGLDASVPDVAPGAVFTRPPARYLAVTSAPLATLGVEGAVRAVLAGRVDGAVVRQADVYLLANLDGPYYAADPPFAQDGSVHSLHIYPATATRQSGYNDASRYLLNALLAHKRIRRLGRRDEFVDATARDIGAVLVRLRRLAVRLDPVDPTAATHIRAEILPLVRDYAHAILAAGLPPALFFSRGFTIDTGQAVNHGRARVLFRGLVSTMDEPVTPWEQRSNFGSSLKENVWRIAPVPFSATPSRTVGLASRGGKNPWGQAPSLVVQEIEPRYVQTNDHRTGRPLRQYRIDGVELEHVRLADALRTRLLPGAEPVDGDLSGGEED